MKKIIIFLGIVFLSCSISPAINIGGGGSGGGSTTGTPVYVEVQDLNDVIVEGNLIRSDSSDISRSIIWDGAASGVYTQQVTSAGFVISGGPLVADGSGLADLPAFQETNEYYVALNGSDTNHGQSVEKPFLTLQHAINVGSAIRQAGGSRSTINVGPGGHGIPVMPTTITWSNGVNIKGSLDRDTILFANIVVDTNMTDGGTMSDLTLMNVGAVANPFVYLPTGTSIERQIRLHRVSLALPAIDDFSAPVVQIDGGWFELSDSVFSIAECAFTNTGLGHTYDFITMDGNDTRVMIKNSRRACPCNRVQWRLSKRCV